MTLMWMQTPADWPFDRVSGLTLGKTKAAGIEGAKTN
jgi:hypothetical protein